MKNQEQSSAAEVPMALENKKIPVAIIRAQMNNDWSGVTEPDRVLAVRAICEVLGIPTPMNPFRFIKTKRGNVTMYAGQEAASLIANTYRLSVKITEQVFDKEQNLYRVAVTATFPDGRSVDDMGVVYLGGSTGDDRANAVMKCITKAKRRVTLSACGLSTYEEDEVPVVSSGLPNDNVNTVNVKLVKYDQSDETSDDRKEAAELMLELYDYLLNKPGPFKGKTQKAKDWIEENGGKSPRQMDASDVMDLIGKAHEEFTVE